MFCCTRKIPPDLSVPSRNFQQPPELAANSDAAVEDPLDGALPPLAEPEEAGAAAVMQGAADLVAPPSPEVAEAVVRLATTFNTAKTRIDDLSSQISQEAQPLRNALKEFFPEQWNGPKLKTQLVHLE